MKKNSFLFASLFTFASLSISSCAEENKSDKTHEEYEMHEMKMSTTDSTAAYQCAMKCKGEKNYSLPGACPVCEMDLIKK